jgi:ribose transport system substrate-binding protein
MSPSFRRSFSRSIVPAAGFVAAALALAACSSSGGSSSSSSSSASSAATSSSSASGKTYNVAYLSYAVANDYDKGMLANAQAVAAKNGIKITVFDAANSSNTQYSQMQTAISSGKYQGIITQPIVGTALVPLVQQAIAAGIKVVNMDQILGPNLSTDAPQVAGLSANVTFVPTDIGTKLGMLVVQACQAKNLNPCKVGYLYDIKASALDVAVYGAVSKAIAADPAVKIVAQGQSFFSPTTGLTAVQDMLTAHPDLNLIVGSDQGIEGGAQAVQAAHRTGKVILVGYGASAAALAGVASGAWYADVAQAPASEGRLAVQALVAALRTGKSSGGIDPVAQLPDGGVVTKANVSQFTAEWPG